MQEFIIRTVYILKPTQTVMHFMLFFVIKGQRFEKNIVFKMMGNKIGHCRK
jgi:hypothetical protein